MPVPLTAHARARLPEWFRVELPTGEAMARYRSTTSAVSDNALHTVCEEAHCPNIHECWGRGTATFMVAGKECTRGCRFCAVETLREPAAPDAHEPRHLADAIAAMGLSYAVIRSSTVTTCPMVEPVIIAPVLTRSTRGYRTSASNFSVATWRETRRRWRNCWMARRCRCLRTTSRRSSA